MRNFYNYYPEIKAEKIGTRNTVCYTLVMRDINGERVYAYEEMRGTPYKLTYNDAKTGKAVSATVFIWKPAADREGNTHRLPYYTMTEATTGAALYPSRKSKKELENYILSDGETFCASGGDYRQHIAAKWEMLLSGIDYMLNNRVNEKFVVIDINDNVKETTDYPADYQEKYFKQAINNGYGSTRKAAAIRAAKTRKKTA